MFCSIGKSKIAVNLIVDTTQNKPSILFICTGNSVRSQVAEGLMRNRYGELFTVFSGGTSPSTVHPESVSTLRELGIDISHHESKSIRDLPISEFDIIITLCDWAQPLCLNLRGTQQTIHWSIPDPSVGDPRTKAKRFSLMRDDLSKRLDNFVRAYLLEEK